MYLGEVAGVADRFAAPHLTSSVAHRQPQHACTAQAASQLFEFGPDGAFIREIGKDLYGFAFAHTVRVDKTATSGRRTKART